MRKIPKIIYFNNVVALASQHVHGYENNDANRKLDNDVK